MVATDGLGLSPDAVRLAHASLVRALLDALRARRRARAKARHRRKRVAADAERVARYLAEHPVRRLQLGASQNALAGWLNSDLHPPTKEHILLDAAAPFPLPDTSFDLVFSEHLIEHLAFADGRRMLAECRRVLRASGRLRIATPDLVRVGDLCTPTTPECQRYLALAERLSAPSDPQLLSAAHVVNRLFRGWGHQFLYDAETLTAELLRAGFANVERVAVGESTHPDLRGIEQHGRTIGEEMNAFETMVFEAFVP